MMRHPPWMCPMRPEIRAVAVAGAALVAVALARHQPWRLLEPAEPPPVTTLKVGFLPVTCHLTCPVTDHATRLSKRARFESLRFTEFPPIADAMRAGHLQATFMIVPLAMKLREQGVPVKIVYLGHRDGSTLVVGRESKARGLRDLAGQAVAIPSRYSNQYLMLRKRMRDEGVPDDAIRFVELPPPEMPQALAVGAIAGYFVGEPHPARAELNGTGRVLYHAKDVWPRFVSCALVVHERLILSEPEVIRELVRGIHDSGEWAETHRFEAARVAAPYFRQDEQLLRYVLTSPPGRVSYRRLTPTDAELADIWQVGVDVGILAGPIALRDLVDRQFIPGT